MKQKLIAAYMKTAEVFAELSHARRLHVGAIVVKDDRIISIGYNGMPAGWDNNCEYEVIVYEQLYQEEIKAINTGELKTRPEVLHAETNAIAKLAKSTESGLGASMFITHAPCLDCAKLIYQSGITSVYYRDAYRDDSGVKFLNNSGINVTQTKEL
jgi:dCMP deaminase